MKFNDIYRDYKGYLEIFKVYKNGDTELAFADDNIVTSGMGYTLSRLFSVSGGSNVSSYQIAYFQVGTSGLNGYQVSTTGELGNSIGSSDWGANASVDLDIHDLLTSGVTRTSEVFGEIPPAFVRRSGDRQVVFQLVLDENTANVTPHKLNEIGLFSRNPDQLATTTSLLCAYRFFTGIEKVDSFALVFRWTIEF